MAEPAPFARGAFLLVYALDQQLSQLLAQRMADSPLTPPDFAVTSALRLAQPCRPTELARILGMRPTTLSNHLRRLGERGLVRRRPDPRDGRAALLQLTAKGRRDTEACFPAFGDAIVLFRKALAEEGVDEGHVLDVFEAVDRALDAAVRAP
jgi:DNA-binding MarR family transcriptional regulator